MSAAQPKFLALAQVMRAHRASLEAHGGLDGVRDAGAIEAAIAIASCLKKTDQFPFVC